MREIIFRAQIMDSDEWVYGSLVYSPSEKQYYIVEHSGDELSYPVKDETIGQFTGLLDTNGNKIFEGDIVQVTIYQNGKYGIRRGSIAYMQSNCTFFIFVQNGYNVQLSSIYKDIEIIGNIYDNPELLKEVWNEKQSNNII